MPTIVTSFVEFVTAFQGLGLDEGSLRDELREIRWESKSAILDARARLTEIVKGAATEVRAFGRKHSLPSDRLMRNVLAALPRRSVHSAYFLLGCQAARLAPGDADWRKAYVKEGQPLEEWPEVFRLAWRLLATQTPPRKDEIALLLGDDPIRCVIATLVHARASNGGRLDPGTELRQLLRKAADDFGSSDSDVAANQLDRSELGRFYKKLAGALGQAELAPLSMDMLDALPEAAGSAILTSSSASHLFRGARTSERTGAHASPSSSPSEAQLRSLAELRRLITRHGFSNAILPSELRNALAPSAIPADVLRHGLRTLFVGYEHGQASPRNEAVSARPRTAKPPASDIRLWTTALAVLSREPADRARAIVELPASSRTALLTALSDESLKRTFEAAAEPEWRYALLQAIAHLSRWESVFGLLDGSDWLATLPLPAIVKNMSYASAQSVWIAIGRHAKTLALKSIPPGVVERLCEHIGMLVRAGRFEEAHGHIRHPRVLRWLLLLGDNALFPSLVRILEALDVPEKHEAPTS